jgi:cysteine desulfurase
MKRIYLDHNATSPLRPQVRDLWQDLTGQDFGNPSSLHASGRKARNLIDESRETIAGLLKVEEHEIIFTSGGTEANNLALFGASQSCKPGHTIIASPTEHPSILEPLAQLKSAGCDLQMAKVGSTGLINPEQLAFATQSKRVGLISIHFANNETGAVQPISDLAYALADMPAKSRPKLHIDAVQALGRIPLDLDGGLAGVDMVSLSMHKIGGPLGVGILVRRTGCNLTPRSFGGGQEEELRAGTENAPAIAASALALELALTEQPTLAENHRLWSAEMWRLLSSQFPALKLTGPSIDRHAARLPNTLNLRMPKSDARMLVTRFDMQGIELSAGSACASGAVEPSHVLLAHGLDEEEARSGLRLSLGWNTSEADCKGAVERMVKVFSSSHATCDEA